jgi:hypothetical protein
MKKKPFESEAALCAAFLAWAKKTAPDVQVYAEWAGWDILLVYPQGWQVGVQAKLRLNAEVIGQAAPSRYDDCDDGPDYRAVLVPELGALYGIASSLGLVVFWSTPSGFAPDLKPRWGPDWGRPDSDWLDWNPRTRHALPPTPTDAIAGSSAPVSLTTWKLLALQVLAELARDGFITTRRIRKIGVDPRRWLQQHWLMPGDKRGDWVRGEKCPPFDTQHPQAYAHVVEKLKAVQP